MREYISESPDQTREYGSDLVKELPAGSCIAVIGNLGAGKTTLVRGIARGLGISGPIVSPTYLLIREYRDGRMPLFHIDAYRISHPDELIEIGGDDYLLTEEGITVVEWADRVSSLLPPHFIEIKISIKGAEKRVLSIKNHDT